MLKAIYMVALRKAFQQTIYQGLLIAVMILAMGFSYIIIPEKIIVTTIGFPVFLALTAWGCWVVRPIGHPGLLRSAFQLGMIALKLAKGWVLYGAHPTESHSIAVKAMKKFSTSITPIGADHFEVTLSLLRAIRGLLYCQHSLTACRKLLEPYIKGDFILIYVFGEPNRIKFPTGIKISWETPYFEVYILPL